jgi:Uma2 family endonuclease
MQTTLERGAGFEAQSQTEERNGLRRWNVDEYHRLKQSGFFGEERVELLAGLIWHPEEPDARRWTREEYYKLGEMGFFDDGRVELLDGRIWTLPPQKTPHFTALRRTTEALEELFGAGHEVRPQGPFALANGSEPEPDILVVPGTVDDYAEHHPIVSDIVLLVEISDSTLSKDRGPKRIDYARAGVKEYWIVNLVNQRLEVSRQPSPEGLYADIATYLPGESVAPLNAPDKSVAVADLLPPTKEQP